MMTHDPFQSYQTLGAYSGGAIPFTNPLMNPLTAGIGTSIHPQQLQQLQLAALAAQTGIPTVFGTQLQSPFTAGLGINPALAGVLHNPLLTAGLNPQVGNPLAQNPFLNPALNPLLNPLLNPVLNPVLNPIVAQQYGITPQLGQISPLTGQVGPQWGQQFGQGIGQPYGQGIGPQFGQVASPYLAPQTPLAAAWYGGQPYGQVNPLAAQFAQRAYQTAGISPWACF